MKKIFFMFFAVMAMLTYSCASQKKWNGYENENLNKYIKLSTLESFEKIIYDPTDNEINKKLFSLIEDELIFGSFDEPIDEECEISINVYFITSNYNDQIDEIIGFKINKFLHGDILKYFIGKLPGENILIDDRSFISFFTDNDAANSASISIIDVKKIKLPNFTEQYCNNLFPGCKSYNDIIDAITANIKTETENEANFESFLNKWNEYVEKSELIAYPYEVYIGYFNEIYERYSTLAESKGMTLEEYSNRICGIPLDELEVEISEKSVVQTKESLVLNETIKRLNIVFSESKYNDYLKKKMSQSTGEYENLSDMINEIGEDNLKNDFFMHEIFVTLK